MTNENYTGKLIIAQPKCITNFFSKSAILIGEHAHNGAWGIIVNRVFSKLESGLTVAMAQAGLDIVDSTDHPLYVGGPTETNRINVVHSLDWVSASTRIVTKDIGVTSDISVLSAIAANEGPEHFRACVGICRWSEGQLEGEMAGMPPWLPEHRWLHAPATLENVFDYQDTYQWQNAIIEAAKETTKEWF